VNGRTAVLLPIVTLGAFGALAYGYVSHWSPDARARSSCETLVLAQLVAPATARFARADVIFDSVFFDVDSQNRAGALVRSSGICKFEFSAGAIQPDTGRVLTLSQR
jgi:hypothetical protein